MAACDHQDGSRSPNEPGETLSQSALIDRLEEEINRAARHGTPLGCLLLRLDGQREIERAHGQRLITELLAYTSAALRREFRRFDRVGDLEEGELLALLPGADAAAAEIVARRALGRLRAIKIEVRGARQPLRVCASIAQWREGQTAAHLIAQVRAAAPDERLGFLDALRI
jgi:GGDEF domain-containing protein